MSLRNRTIRLAYEQPSLRPHLLPLVMPPRADAHKKMLALAEALPEYNTAFLEGAAILQDHSRTASEEGLEALIEKLTAWGKRLISGIHLSGPVEAAAEQMVNKAKAGKYNPSSEINKYGPLAKRLGDSMGIPNMDRMLKEKALKTTSLAQGMALLADLRKAKTVGGVLEWLGGKPLSVKTADALSLIYQTLQYQLTPERLLGLVAASGIVVFAMVYTAHLNTRWLLTKSGFKMIGTSFLYAPIFLLMLITSPLSWVLGFLYDTFWPWRAEY